MEHDSVSTHQLQWDGGTAVQRLGTQPHYKHHYRLSERDRVGMRRGDKSCKTARCRVKPKRRRRTTPPNSPCVAVGVMMHGRHIKAPACLSRAFLYLNVCAQTELQRRGSWDEKWQASLILAFYFSLYVLSSDPPNYHSLTVQGEEEILRAEGGGEKNHFCKNEIKRSETSRKLR